ncbi:hypothetical protein EII17_03985 [Clostridiales bacterium COT073_COT-073]|nr:hypothetical protein EII17_03985 [Clostridiales bacterium COT073_COT-073]
MENYKIPFIVKILDKILPAFMGKNVDYQTVRKILILKMTLDGRRTSVLAKAQNANKKKEPKNLMIFNFIMYAVLGIFVAGMQLLDNVFIANTIAYGMLIFVLLSVYIGEFSEILLDTKEKPFYKVLPIQEKELAIAKNIHISLYIGGIAVATMLPSLAAAVYAKGIFYALLYLMMAVIVAMFCLWLAGGLYFLLLKVFSGEKLKDILNYFQVFMTIAIIVGYQIIPRVINFQQINQMQLSDHPAYFILPSAWYSAIFAIVFQGQRSFFFYALLGLGIVVILGFLFLNRYYIMPQFEKELSKLEQSSTENKALTWRKRVFCKLFSKNGQDRAFMELISIHLSRDRNLKLKLYPQLANAFIIPMIVLASVLFSNMSREGVSFVEMMQTIRAMPFYLALYMIVLVAPGIYYIICQSDDTATTWIYQTLPWRDLRDLIKGGIKVVIGQYLSPIFIFAGLLFVILYGLKIVPDLLIIYLFFLLYTQVMIRISSWHLPFSIVGQVKSSGRQVAYFLLGFLMVGVVGAGHFFLLQSIWTKFLAIPVIGVIDFLWWKYGMRKEYVLNRA